MEGVPAEHMSGESAFEPGDGAPVGYVRDERSFDDYAVDEQSLSGLVHERSLGNGPAAAPRGDYARVTRLPMAEPSDADTAGPGSGGERYGHRIAGWVRPEYRHVPEEPRSGEYWTPIPVDLEADPEPSAKGYGWPMPVERLPSVPDYEPSTGFDLTPVEHEPTEVVTAMPTGRARRGRGDRGNRVHLPRSWSARDEKHDDYGDEPTAREWRVENQPTQGRRRGDSTQLFAAVTNDPPPADRRRPRPRPRPSAEPTDRSTTMYQSRHAAEPPPR